MARNTMAAVPVPGQVYRHLNQLEYAIICLAKDDENEDLLVIHKGLHDGAIWSRRIGNFMGLKHGTPRFILVKD